MDSSEGEKSELRKRPLPSSRDFIMCERVIRDSMFGKISLIDVFENITAPSFPCQYRCWYFCTLMDGHGELNFEVLLRNLETDKKVVIWNGRVMLDPVKPAALVNNIQPIFEAPGLYEFIIRAPLPDGRVIATRQFTVEQLITQTPTI